MFHKKHLGDKPITMGSLIDLLFIEIKESITRNDHNTIHVFLGFALCVVYFPMHGGDRVFTKFWPILNNLKNLQKYAWGKIMYQYLCNRLTEVQQTIIMCVPSQRKVTMRDFTIFLQITKL